MAGTRQIGKKSGQMLGKPHQKSAINFLEVEGRNLLIGRYRVQDSPIHPGKDED